MSFHLRRQVIVNRVSMFIASGGVVLMLVLCILPAFDKGNGTRAAIQQEEWKQRHLVVDRIEQDHALCQSFTGGVVCLPKDMLPPCLDEGDVLERIDGRLQVSGSMTRIRKSLTEEKANLIWQQ